MTETSWAHLPNAAYIDTVLRHIRIYYHLWPETRDEDDAETERRRNAEPRLIRDMNEQHPERQQAVADVTEWARVQAREACADAEVRRRKVAATRYKDIPRDVWMAACDYLGRPNGSALLSEVKELLVRQARNDGARRAAVTYAVNAVRALAVYDSAPDVFAVGPIPLTGHHYIAPEQVLLQPAVLAHQTRPMAFPKR